MTSGALWEHTVQDYVSWPERNSPRAAAGGRDDTEQRELNIFLNALWHHCWWRWNVRWNFSVVTVWERLWSCILRLFYSAVSEHVILKCFNDEIYVCFSFLVRKDEFWMFCHVSGQELTVRIDWSQCTGILMWRKKPQQLSDICLSFYVTTHQNRSCSSCKIKRFIFFISFIFIIILLTGWSLTARLIKNK